MTRYTSDVTLPDGRQFHVVARFTEWEADTNACDFIDAEITYPDGEEVPVEVQNEELPSPTRYDANATNYLWSVCVDLACQQPPDEPDEDWL